MLKLLLASAAIVLVASGALAEEPHGRPGVFRDPYFAGVEKCHQVIYGDVRDLDHEVPCDDRYKEGEKIAGYEFLIKRHLKSENSPGNKADWEAWEASAASGASTFNDRLTAYFAELRKQALQHAEGRAFLSGMCQPNNEKEQTDQAFLQGNCKDEEITFQREYWLALQGDHREQENVASCFEQGDSNPKAPLIQRWPCNRVVRADETTMCAWYLVAASSGHKDSSQSAGRYGYDYECDKKPAYVRQAILGTASELFLRIYHRPLPVAR
jgi:hypothetical protein